MDLCVILLSWILQFSDYQEVDGCPEMRSVSHAWLEEQACAGRQCKVLGWYPGEGDVVYLDDGMDIEDNLLHTSIALHEIVHWVQHEEGTLSDSCASSINAEREAYHIQRQFLELYGSYYPTGAVLPMLRCTE